MRGKKLTYEFVKEQFEKVDYELLTDYYINNQQKLKFKCNRGHNHEITYANFSRGIRCYFCDIERRKFTYKFIEAKFEKEGYRLLTGYYTNIYQKLKFVCPEGHQHEITYASFSQGRRCKVCDIKKQSINRCFSYEFIKQQFEKEGYKLLSTEYINSKQKLEYICPKGHRYSITYGNFSQGHRCPECVEIISKGEIDVKNFIKSLGIKVLSNDRNQIFNPETGYGFELDAFMPVLNKAIEYNGEYWHKNKTMEARDLLKQQLCKSKGINLLTIWDKEWKADSGGCKNKIMKFIFD